MVEKVSFNELSMMVERFEASVRRNIDASQNGDVLRQIDNIKRALSEINNQHACGRISASDHIFCLPAPGGSNA